MAVVNQAPNGFNSATGAPGVSESRPGGVTTTKGRWGGGALTRYLYALNSPLFNLSR